MNHTFLEIARTLADIGDTDSADHFIARAAGYKKQLIRSRYQIASEMTDDDFEIMMNRCIRCKITDLLR